MPEEYQHICVVRAFSDWMLVSGFTEGYLFRKIRTNDRLAEENESMVGIFFLRHPLLLIEMFRRPNNFLKCFGTIFLILALTLFPMELIHFDVVDASGCLSNDGGLCARSVNGGDGVRSLPT